MRSRHPGPADRRLSARKDTSFGSNRAQWAPFYDNHGWSRAGKTSLIGELRRRGFAGTQEAGRAIIANQAIIGGRATHTADAALFAELMLAWGMRRTGWPGTTARRPRSSSIAASPS
jgi:hypothetical protein